jgi:hypothetical protein
MKENIGKKFENDPNSIQIGLHHFTIYSLRYKFLVHNVQIGLC